MKFCEDEECGGMLVSEKKDGESVMECRNCGKIHDAEGESLKFSEEKEDDPMEIGLDKAIDLIKEKRIEDEKKVIKTFDEKDDMLLLNGRWGPYLKIGKKNFKLPKDAEPEKLTYEECIEISENQPKRTGKRKTTKKKSAKKK